MLERILLFLLYAVLVGFVIYVVRMLLLYLMGKMDVGPPWPKLVDAGCAVVAVILVLYLLIALVSGRPYWAV